jgi:hypothetical protein
MAESVAESGQWLTQTEAAVRLGWHIERVKAAARRGKLERRKNNQGQWLVLVMPELLPRATQSNGNGSALGAYGTANGAGQGTAEIALGDAHAVALAMAELREELTEARVAAAHAEGKAAALAAALDYEHAERSRLAAELAEARKGWLERLLEAVRRR